MEMQLESPTRLYLPSDSDDVKRFLSFEDRGIGFQMSKMKRNHFWKRDNPESFAEAMENLKAQQKRTLLFYDENGRPYTYAGLTRELNQAFKWSLIDHVSPNLNREYGGIPWNKKPYDMHYYQAEAVEKLIEARHAAIELPTGSGKSLILVNLAKRLPTETLIVTPFKSITEALHDQFVDCFGQKYVGQYGGGKKKLGKLFTVATSDSIAGIEKGSDAWDWFRQCKTLMWDESHTTPADSFEQACMGVAENAVNRFFVSATQLRNDGSEMVLKGITGPVVYRKGFKELVNEGYLAPQIFNMVEVPSVGYVNRLDPKEETRAQLYSNHFVNKMAGDIANWATSSEKRPTLIIIEEFKQFLQIRPYLKCKYAFVHGGVSKENKEFVPQEFWDIDRQQIIADFNAGKIPCLIGTSAIATGVDLKPTQCSIYLQGGTSETKVRQAIGRGTRVCKEVGKKDCINFDFKVMGSKTMERHAEARREIYETMGEVRIHSGRK